MNDTLTNRTAYLATSEANKTASKKMLDIVISGTLPFMLIDADLVARTRLDTITEAPRALGDIKNTLVEVIDSIVTDRYVYLTRINSPITHSTALLYYDKVFKDIIIIPDTKFYLYDDTVIKSGTFQIQAYRLGAGERIAANYGDLLINTNNNTKYNLPSTNTNIENICTANLIVGLEKGTDRVINIQQDVGSNIRYDRFDAKPVILVNLKNVLNVFEETTQLPMYLVHQVSQELFGIHYLGGVDPKTNDIYFAIQF